jgi:opacity protein-like surface antigen
MKKLLSLIAFLFSFVWVNAQTIKAVTFSGGYVRADHNMKFDGRFQSLSTKPINSWGLDAGLEFWNTSVFSFSASVGMIKKGYNYDIPVTTVTQPEGTGEIIEGRLRLNYLYLAPRFAVKLSAKKFVPYVFVVPRTEVFLYTSHKLYRSDDSEITDDGSFGGFRDFYKNNHRALLFGVTTGFGLEYKIHKNVSLGIEAAYLVDITPAVKTESSGNNVGMKAYNRAFSASLVFKHYFGKN